MYDGQLIICKDIIEDNWLEYLAYLKEVSDKELERQQKRLKALEGIEDVEAVGLSDIATKEPSMYDHRYDHRYYDIGINGFWSWYVTNKIGVKNV